MHIIHTTYVLRIDIPLETDPMIRGQDTLESTEPKRQKHLATFHCVTKNFLADVESCDF